jgi:hypothetical protein
MDVTGFIMRKPTKMMAGAVAALRICWKRGDRNRDIRKSTR